MNQIKHIFMVVFLLSTFHVANAEVLRVERRIKIHLQSTINLDDCLANFKQTNNTEPLATCKVSLSNVQPTSIVEPVAVWPTPMSNSLDTVVGNNISCTGGVEGNEHPGAFNVFVNLSPYRRDYGSEEFKDCFSFVVSQLVKNNRSLLIKATDY